MEGLVALGLFELYFLSIHIMTIVLIVPSCEIRLNPSFLPVEFLQLDMVELLLPEFFLIEMVALWLALLLESVEVHGDPHDLAQL